LAALAGGNLSRALWLNPLVAMTALGAGAAAAASLWRRWTHRPALRCLLSRPEEIALRAGVATAVALNWIYLMLGR